MFQCGKTLSDKYVNRRQEGARFALLVLSGIQLLNFADRYVPGSVKSLIKEDLKLTDTETALPTTGMLIVYMVFSALSGHIVDKQLVGRRSLLACGIMAWSIATALAGLSCNFAQLLAFRSLVGVGEAAYSTIVPPMLADFYPIRDRNLAFTIYNVCSPLGGALGFIVGSMLGGAYGWRVAFFVCGLPGVIVSCVIPMINDPHRGVNDPKALADQEPSPGWTGYLKDLRDIVCNPHWALCTVGCIACSFTVGGVTDWYEVLLLRTHQKASVQGSGMILGAATMLGGIGGTLLGANLAEFSAQYLSQAYFVVPALLMLPCAVFMFLAINVSSSLGLAYACVLLSWIFFFGYLSPINALQVNCMPVRLRCRASACSILLCHVLGDVISPPIIGQISDRTGHLRTGMQLCWIAPLVACLAWGLGSCLLPVLPRASDKQVDAATKRSSLGSLLCSSAEEQEEEALLVEDKGGYASVKAVQQSSFSSCKP
mmetsp:Transcript_55667/g.129623  ORF Transcript_55667/g.129623 Transcript_55667/m.129623 type:complete len:485 (+) Transcript_55667:67-1521(+)